LLDNKDQVNGPVVVHIIENLNLDLNLQPAKDQLKAVIDALCKYYTASSLQWREDYNFKWVGETDDLIDFVNGFIYFDREFKKTDVTGVQGKVVIFSV
jgi:hypothetical protein